MERLEALQPIGTDWHKLCLEPAPWLIAIFAQKWGRAGDGPPRFTWLPRMLERL